MPKGLSGDTLTAVVDRLRGESPAGLSANEVSTELGIARVTARRYLEHLAERGLVERTSRYGRAGRPEHSYLWRDPGS